MSTDLYKIQNKLEQPRKQKKPKKSSVGFSVQQKRLEESNYLVRNKKTKNAKYN